MKYINEKKIEALLAKAKRSPKKEIEAILKKSRLLKRLSLKEVAALLAVCDPLLVEKIFETAATVKNAIYGSRIVLFAPLYISNLCANRCLYCAFRADNTSIQRRFLTSEDIRHEVRWLLERGHKRILLVAGESAPSGKDNIDHYTEAVRAIYSAQVGPHKIKRVNVNCAPLSVSDFKKLKASGIGTYQLFQETYHEATYRRVHTSGPKSDPDNRIDAIDRAYRAGIDDVGMGVLYGLYDYRFEVLALLMHIEHLEKKFHVGPHTISVPRIEPAPGVDFMKNCTTLVSDEDFKKIVAILRLAVPYTGLILTTRETPAMRNELVNLGISQISAESRTSPGGYSLLDEDNRTGDGQFYPSDLRSLDEIIGSLVAQNLTPSFCAACYRKERTGEAFMDLAKPGLIKRTCQINALVTLKEYLDDFASESVKHGGYKLIEEAKTKLDKKSKMLLTRFFEGIDQGVRDAYV